MDFEFDEDQQALSELAARLLAAQATPERVKQVEADAASGGDGIDHKLWVDMAAAGLLSAPLGEDSGGAGVGLVGAGAVLEEVGRRVAPVPYLEAVLSALAIERFGSAELRDLLGGIADGSKVIVPALSEVQGDPRVPSTMAVAGSELSTLVLHGEKVCVPAGMAADWYLVPARVAEDTTCVAVVPAGAPGLTRERQDTTFGRPEALLTLSGVTVPSSAVLGIDGETGDVLGWLIERMTAGLCVLAAGCVDEAVRITASYVKERKQWERPLATFQAVGQRAADAYIDALGVRLTAWQALWRLSVGLPAADEVTIAKYWASEAGQRAVHACQHLHGGIGMDRDYPVHRYFLVAKQIDLALGGAAPQLADLGRRMAASA
jgi:alkylation response protein AidB-like acyl-CoA dehydrogenase